MEITYDQGSEFIGHKLRKYLIETEYGITANLITLGNPTSNAILEQIHQVLGNLLRNFNIKETYIKETYVDEDDPWSVILASSAFTICSTTNRLKIYTPVQLVFGRDMILPIKHNVDWELIPQKK